MRGFTLIEMIVVVAVIAIVASIAYPAYQDYIVRTRRTEAKALLMELASKLERCFVEYNAYNHKDCPLQNNATVSSSQGFYTVKVEIPSGTAFTLSAIPQGAHANDKCGKFVLEHTGKVSVPDAPDSMGDTPEKKLNKCWDR